MLQLSLLSLMSSEVPEVNFVLPLVVSLSHMSKVVMFDIIREAGSFEIFTASLSTFSLHMHRSLNI